MDDLTQDTYYEQPRWMLENDPAIEYNYARDEYEPEYEPEYEYDVHDMAYLYSFSEIYSYFRHSNRLMIELVTTRIVILARIKCNALRVTLVSAWYKLRRKPNPLDDIPF